MLRLRTLGAALLVAVVVLTLVGPAAAQEEPITLTLYRFFGECSDEFAGITSQEEAYGECGIIQVLTNQWNAENPDIQIETVVTEWPGTTELNTALAAGAPPDIMVLHRFRIPNYASRGLLTPLDDVFEAVGWPPPEGYEHVTEAESESDEKEELAAHETADKGEQEKE